jgi:hypothetical protein
MTVRAESEASTSPIRMAAASFAAGVGFMLLAGLVAPLVADGGLSMRSAEASQLQARPVIELDVDAVRAQLGQAEQAMESNFATTDAAMLRLQRLSGE